MGNSSTKLAERCSLLSKDEVPVVASSFKFVSKNSERIKEDDLMVSIVIQILKMICFSRSPFVFSSLFNSVLKHLNACMQYTLYCLEILGITNGPTTSSIYNEFFIWHFGQSINGC